jgi:hypothetical protein
VFDRFILFFLLFFSLTLISLNAVDYPYINYGVANRQQTNGEEWQQTARLASLERFEPQNLRYFSDHLVDVYEEAATIARPPLQPACRRPLSNKTGYIVCVYKVFDGDDGEKFERNWLYWTGQEFSFDHLLLFILFIWRECQRDGWRVHYSPVQGKQMTKGGVGDLWSWRTSPPIGGAGRR